MGEPVLIIGESGSGKSASLRNFQKGEIGIFSVSGKNMPFRTSLQICRTKNYNVIFDALSKPNLNAYAIDDSQYLMAFEFFDRAKENGYQKFADIGLHFQRLIEFVRYGMPDDIIVYFLHHAETTEFGKLKAKTVGKMLDDKLTVEGMFNVVLFAKTDGQRFYFETKSNGMTTAKSPMDMFPNEIDNDLKAVDTAIRDYFELAPLVPEKPDSPEKEPDKKQDTGESKQLDADAA